MNPFARGSVVVLGPDEGESLWQPLPSRGYIINKLTPYNTPYDTFSLGIQVLAPDAHIRRHAHERHHEVLFCYAGEGWAEIGDQRYEVRPETTMLIGRAVHHTFWVEPPSCERYRVGPRWPVEAAISSTPGVRGSATRWWMMWPRKMGPWTSQSPRPVSLR